MTIDPTTLLRRYHHAIERRDYAVIETCFAPDAVYLSGGTGNISGRDAIMVAFREYFNVYPDQVASDDKVERLSHRMARAFWRLNATHSISGVPLAREGVEAITFDDAGRIVEVLVEDR